jgi:hypothetical protein
VASRSFWKKPRINFAESFPPTFVSTWNANSTALKIPDLRRKRHGSQLHRLLCSIQTTWSSNPEDYDYFIEDPYACIIERVLPRNFRGLEPINNPYRSMMTMYQSALGQAATQKESYFALIVECSMKNNGFYSGEPGGTRRLLCSPGYIDRHICAV